MLEGLGLMTVGLSEAGIEWLRDNELSTDNLAGFAAALGSSPAELLAAAQLRDELCTDQQSEMLLVFDDPDMGSRVVGQLCNLTFTQFEQLTNDIYLDSADGLLILGQVSAPMTSYAGFRKTRDSGVVWAECQVTGAI